MVKKIFGKKGEILFVKRSTLITSANLCYLIDYIKSDDSLPRNLLIIEDFTEDTFEFNLYEMKQLRRKFADVAKNFNSIKYAIIVDTPLKYAITQSFVENTPLTNATIKTFFLSEMAFRWLDD